MATPQEIQLQQALNDLIKDQRDLITEINNELKGGINYTKEIRKQYNLIEGITDKLLDDAAELVELDEKQLEKLRVQATKALEGLQTAGKRLATERQQIEATRKLTDQELILLAATDQGFINEQETLRLVNARIDKQKSLNKAVGLTGTLLKGSAGLMEKIGFSSTIVEESLIKAKNASYNTANSLQLSGKNIDTLGVKIQTMAVGLKSLGGSLVSSLKDPLVQVTLLTAAFKGIWDLNKELDQTLSDQGRQLAINKEESYKLYDAAEKYAFSTHDSFVTAALLTKNQNALNVALGTSVNYTNQSVEGFSRLTHYYGLSADAAGKLEQFGQLQGKNSNAVLKSTISTVAQIKLQQGGTISYQKVLAQVSNTGGDILMNFKGNTAALAAAIVNADKLGLSLEQVDKIGESLLNFESSIENELKAELLTGKAINVEKARQYALDGDLAKLTTEVAKQVGGIHEYEKMNVIQRKAYAEAFGMSNKEMAEMLQKADFESKLAGSTAKTAEEKLKYAKEHNITMADSVKQALEQKSLADEQHEVFAKLKEVLVRITSGPMKALFHQMEKILGMVGKVTNLFGGMSGAGLGTAITGALLLIPGLFLLKNLFLRGTDMVPTVVRMQGGAGMMGGIAGGNKTGGAGFGTDYRALRASGVSRGESLSMSRQANPMGARMAGGIGLGVAGMGINAIAGGMGEGTGKDVVGTVGQAATYAGMGMMVGGPIGAGIGALVGLTTGLLDISRKSEERATAESASRKEAEKKTRDLMESLSVRPIKLGMNATTLQEWSTNSQQSGANNSYS